MRYGEPMSAEAVLGRGGIEALEVSVAALSGGERAASAPALGASTPSRDAAADSAADQYSADQYSADQYSSAAEGVASR